VFEKKKKRASLGIPFIFYYISQNKANTFQWWLTCIWA